MSILNTIKHTTKNIIKSLIDIYKKLLNLFFVVLTWKKINWKKEWQNSINMESNKNDNSDLKTKRYHWFHILGPSPWPLALGVMAFPTAVGLVSYMHGLTTGDDLFSYSFLICSFILSLWFRDIIRESIIEGSHTKQVDNNTILGFKLFLFTETMLFVTFFWAYFYAAFYPSVNIGLSWPPVGLSNVLVDPFLIPLANTLILVYSGFTLTISHLYLRKDNIISSSLYLFFTILLGTLFLYIQYNEFLHCGFDISDGIYGSTFFMLTGFHGGHVIIGVTGLIITFSRLVHGHFSGYNHIGFKLALIYWHFVDVIWIFVYLFVYILGSDFTHPNGIYYEVDYNDDGLCILNKIYLNFDVLTYGKLKTYEDLETHISKYDSYKHLNKWYSKVPHPYTEKGLNQNISKESFNQLNLPSKLINDRNTVLTEKLIIENEKNSNTTNQINFSNHRRHISRDPSENLPAPKWQASPELMEEIRQHYSYQKTISPDVDTSDFDEFKSDGSNQFILEDCIGEEAEKPVYTDQQITKTIKRYVKLTQNYSKTGGSIKEFISSILDRKIVIDNCFTRFLIKVRDFSPEYQQNVDLLFRTRPDMVDDLLNCQCDSCVSTHNDELKIANEGCYNFREEIYSTLNLDGKTEAYTIADVKKMEKDQVLKLPDDIIIPDDIKSNDSKFSRSWDTNQEQVIQEAALAAKSRNTKIMNESLLETKELAQKDFKILLTSIDSLPDYKKDAFKELHYMLESKSDTRKYFPYELYNQWEIHRDSQGFPTLKDFKDRIEARKILEKDFMCFVLLLSPEEIANYIDKFGKAHYVDNAMFADIYNKGLGGPSPYHNKVESYYTDYHNRDYFNPFEPYIQTIAVGKDTLPLTLKEFYLTYKTPVKYLLLDYESYLKDFILKKQYCILPEIDDYANLSEVEQIGDLNDEFEEYARLTDLYRFQQDILAGDVDPSVEPFDWMDWFNLSNDENSHYYSPVDKIYTHINNELYAHESCRSCLERLIEKQSKYLENLKEACPTGTNPYLLPAPSKNWRHAMHELKALFTFYDLIENIDDKLLKKYIFSGPRPSVNSK